METIIFASIFIGLAMLGLGVGVLFFGKTANRESCGSVPEVSHDDCPSHKMGLCPIEDPTGLLKLANKSKISYKKHDISS